MFFNSSGVGSFLGSGLRFIVGCCWSLVIDRSPTIALSASRKSAICLASGLRWLSVFALRLSREMLGSGFFSGGRAAGDAGGGICTALGGAVLIATRPS